MNILFKSFKKNDIGDEKLHITFFQETSKFIRLIVGNTFSKIKSGFVFLIIK